MQNFKLAKSSSSFLLTHCNPIQNLPITSISFNFQTYFHLWIEQMNYWSQTQKYFSFKCSLGWTNPNERHGLRLVVRGDGPHPLLGLNDRLDEEVGRNRDRVRSRASAPDAVLDYGRNGDAEAEGDFERFGKKIFLFILRR
jgi:hypothetical protein